MARRRRAPLSPEPATSTSSADAAMLSPDDPRLAAYSDGQLPLAEAARLERELASSPAARAELERLRALQHALREAFAVETAEDGVFAADGEPAEAAATGTSPARPYPVYRDMGADERSSVWRATAREALKREPAREGWLAWLFPGWLAPVAGAACVLMLIAAIAVPQVVRMTTKESALRSVASSNLRQIGQASLIFASDNADKIPAATDVWDFARQLAVGGGLNDASIWINPIDPGARETSVTTVLAADGKTLDTAFAKLKPSIAVLLSGLDTGLEPSTTPIAWTRGLQPDGTWAAHSPYGTRGGHIVFLGGNVQYFHSVVGQLDRYDGKGKTSDIREALPPGAVIGEYTPTATEAAEWAKAYRPDRNSDHSVIGRMRASKQSMVFVVGAWLLGTVAILVLVIRRRSVPVVA